MKNNMEKSAQNFAKDTYVLEPSTHPHVLESDKKIEAKVVGAATVLTLNGKSLVHHGEHGVIAIESNHAMKFIQQELNPISKKFQNAFD